MRLIALATLLFAFWLLLSGHYTAWLIGSGAVVALIVALFAHYARVDDEEGFPIERIIGGLGYWPWLVKEITKSALSVTRIILDPRLPVSPRFVRAEYSARTSVGIATYANSITLTPGTITVDVDQSRRSLMVHALTGDAAADLESGEMDRRVRRFEGGR